MTEKEPAKKLPCPDCTFCQWCSDDRCRMCRKKGSGKKLSLREQIELYDRINAQKEGEREACGCPCKSTPSTKST